LEVFEEELREKNKRMMIEEAEVHRRESTGVRRIYRML
jgi:hypothetical protein